MLNFKHVGVYSERSFVMFKQPWKIIITACSGNSTHAFF